MNHFQAIQIIETEVIETEEDHKDEYLEAWQHLVDTGLAYQLQGSYGRTAQALIEAGVIQEPTHSLSQEI